jgi:hypothetical protein
MSVHYSYHTAHVVAPTLNQDFQIANLLLRQNQLAITVIFLLSALNLAQYFNRGSASDETLKNALNDCQSGMAKCKYSKPFCPTNGFNSDSSTYNLVNDTLIKEFLDPAPSPFPLGSQQSFDAFVLKKKALDEQCKTLDICSSDSVDISH